MKNLTFAEKAKLVCYVLAYVLMLTEILYRMMGRRSEFDDLALLLIVSFDIVLLFIYAFVVNKRRRAGTQTNLTYRKASSSLCFSVMLVLFYELDMLVFLATGFVKIAAAMFFLTVGQIIATCNMYKELAQKPEES